MFFDPVGRAPYAIDASLYEIDPLGVIVPRSTQDVVTTLRYAAEHNIPVHARGAGTGLAGESLGPGLVIDFSRHLRRVVAIGPDWVTVQPGVVLDVLNAQLAPLGRKIGPDPSGSMSCTVGGMIGGDAAGARSLKYGTTADAVMALEVAFATGEEAHLECEPWPEEWAEPSNLKSAIARRVALHLRWHADLIARSMPKSARNRAGYALHAVARPEGIDLSRLIVGSEGTLALVTQATLRTVPLPSAQGVVLLPFSHLQDAAQAVESCLEGRPAACELYDWRRLNLARDADSSLRGWITEEAEAALVVVFEGDDPDEISQGCRELTARIARRGGLAADATVSTRRSDCERLMNLRDIVMPQLMRAPGPARPVPLIEDVAVPPGALPEFLRQLQSILKSHGVNWLFHAHAGCGQTHARPFLDLASPEDRAKLGPIATDVYEAALALGGTISGEHGCGLVRTQFLRRQYGELEQVFREIKHAFDPRNLLNPGKIVGGAPDLMLRDLRSAVPGTTGGQAGGDGGLPVLNGPLTWSPRTRLDHIAACNGCGNCRAQTPELRMCPTFRAERFETASPRAKVNLLREIASGRLDPRVWGSEEARAQASLCVHCGLCQTECPAGIDVSSLMMEVKAAYVENHGLAPTDWVFSHIDLWSRWASRLPGLSNALLRNRASRRWIERLAGLSRHRVVPRVERGSYVRVAEGLGLTRARPHEPGPRVAYFLDVFANYYDHELAGAVVEVLRHCGVNTYVPKGQRGCGMPALVAGDLDRARSLLAANLKVLGDAVRDGYTIVCSEPTATLLLTRESLKLSDDLDAGLVARNTMDVGQYLWGLAERGGLPPFVEPIVARIGYHQPCHLRAQGIGTPGLELVRLIPGVEGEFIDRGCSGIAGVFGLSRRNFRTSLRAGRGLRERLADRDIDLGSTECGACRMQMEQGLTKRTLHPMKLLSLAYGLNAGLRGRLKQPKPRHEID